MQALCDKLSTTMHGPAGGGGGTLSCSSSIECFVQGVGVRAQNLVRNGDLAPFRQPFVDVDIRTAWARLLQDADVAARQAAVAEFNASQHDCKKGLAMVPTVRHVSLGKTQDNQGAAVVNVFLDGTVVVHTGG